MSNTGSRNTNQLGSVTVDLLGVIGDRAVGLVTGVGDTENIGPLLELLVEVLIVKSGVNSSVEAMACQNETGLRKIMTYMSKLGRGPV